MLFDYTKHTNNFWLNATKTLFFTDKQKCNASLQIFTVTNWRELLIL